MLTFEELYRRILLATAQNRTKEELASLAASNYDRTQLDCLFHPERHPLVWRFADGPTADGAPEAAPAACEFEALSGDGGRVVIDDERCTGCEECIRLHPDLGLIASKDAVAALEALHRKRDLAYALVAPAFLGQFGPSVTPGKLRSAFKAMGFDGMIEVAVFADILTLKEALEFDRNIQSESDYQLTSCCCPMWIAMIRKVYSQLVPHIPAAVSPMIAAGRAIKLLHPEALTVFVGPCLAKKAEAREADLKGAVDYVLTFQETREVFAAFGLDPAALPESEKEFSSRAGRIYARAGGVSEAVERTLGRINPHRDIAIRSRRADGVPACKAKLNDIIEGRIVANFYEGMGCVGGCVGGPRVIIDREEARERVSGYGDSATYPTPIDNPYVVDLLRRLGYATTEQLLEHSAIFTRSF